MAKWSLRIEMQAVDVREYCPIYSKVYSTGEISDSFDNIVRRL
jgi:hypothetical protein